MASSSFNSGQREKASSAKSGSPSAQLRRISSQQASAAVGSRATEPDCMVLVLNWLMVVVLRHSREAKCLGGLVELG